MYTALLELLQETPKNRNIDVGDLCLVFLFFLFWDQGTVIFQLSGFYCKAC